VQAFNDFFFFSAKAKKITVTITLLIIQTVTYLVPFIFYLTLYNIQPEFSSVPAVSEAADECYRKDITLLNKILSALDFVCQYMCLTAVKTIYSLTCC